MASHAAAPANEPTTCRRVVRGHVGAAASDAAQHACDQSNRRAMWNQNRSFGRASSAGQLPVQRRKSRTSGTCEKGDEAGL